jgi:hypothetical protein
MAVLAAFLLIGATAAGVNSPLNKAGDATSTVVSNSQPAEKPAKVSPVRSVKAGKGFKASLYLFRRN